MKHLIIITLLFSLSACGGSEEQPITPQPPDLPTIPLPEPTPDPPAQLPTPEPPVQLPTPEPEESSNWGEARWGKIVLK